VRLAVLLVALIAGTAWLDTTPVHLTRDCAASALAPWLGRPPQGHAHNDYLHPHPLTSALKHGFTSVEADVWPVDGRLLVAHQRDQVDPSRTLESLYLQPLARDLHDATSPVPAHLQLLVDVKGSPGSTLPLLRAELASYAGMLTSYRGCTVVPGRVSVVVSGNAHPLAPRSGGTSLFGYDQPLERGSHPSVEEAVTPLVSGDWAQWFTWEGRGDMPAREHDRLVRLVEAAHAAGSAIRFWDTPDDPGPARDALWRELTEDGVDWLSTDDLAGYAAFLRQSQPAPSRPSQERAGRSRSRTRSAPRRLRPP